MKDAGGSDIPIPSLQREYLSSSGRPIAEEVASSIEQIQFQYGIDTEGNFTANQYLNANQINNDTTSPNWTEVVAIRLWVLVRADCPTNGYTNSQTYTMGDVDIPASSGGYKPNDGFKRQLYSTTVAVRN